MHDFKPGDIVYERRNKRRAVVVDPTHTTRPSDWQTIRHIIPVVFFAPGNQLLNNPIYTSQRAWGALERHLELSIKPPPSEEALAMRILLTNYVPGLDDDY
jgi:hypothetical protein